VRPPALGSQPNQKKKTRARHQGQKKRAGRTQPKKRLGYVFFSKGRIIASANQHLPACLPSSSRPGSGSASLSTASLPFGFRVLDGLVTAALLGFPSDAMD
jgi:hypothetical protein